MNQRGTFPVEDSACLGKKKDMKLEIPNSSSSFTHCWHMTLSKSLTCSEPQSPQNEDKNAYLLNLLELLWVKWCTLNLTIKCYIINSKRLLVFRNLQSRRGDLKHTEIPTVQGKSQCKFDRGMNLFIGSKYLLSLKWSRWCSDEAQRS